MKPLRIVQIVLLVLVAIYLLLLHNQNPTNLAMPFFISLPPALVIAVAVLLGWLLGWSVGRMARWRRERELRKLRSRLEDIEQHLPNYDTHTAVIPDRSGSSLKPAD